MNTGVRCPKCLNPAYLIGSRYYCHCGWSKKRERLEDLEKNTVKRKEVKDGLHA